MAKIKTVETAEEFLSLVEKSCLLTDELFAEFREAGQSNPDPKALARDLLKKGWLTKWQAAQLLSGFYRLKLENYLLCDQIGKGEMGRVYLAEHAKLGKHVAIKALSPRHTNNPEAVQRFLKEAQAASALEHENIVHIQDVSSEGDRHFVVMEYVKGRDLQRRVKDEGPLAFRDLAEIICQAAKGLGHAHEQGVVHADLKPANILVDDRGVVKILDVGVGQLRQAEKTSKESTGEILLSAISYMSPEQARGLDADAQSDVYALGGTMYYILTGRVPFSAGTDEERRAIRQSKRPLPIKGLRADTPDPLVETCQKMMAIRRNNRFASMQEVIESLTQWLEGSPTSVPPEPEAEVETPVETAVETNDKEKGVFGWAPKEKQDGPAPSGAGEEPAEKVPASESTEANDDAAEVELIPDSEDEKEPQPASRQAKKESEPEKPATPPERPKKKKPKSAFPLSIVLSIAGAVCIIVVLAVVLVMVMRSGEETSMVSEAEQDAAAADVDPEPDTEDVEDIEEQPDIENVPDPDMETTEGETQEPGPTEPGDGSADDVKPEAASAVEATTLPKKPAVPEDAGVEKPADTMEKPVASVAEETPATDAPVEEKPPASKPEKPAPATEKPESPSPKPQPKPEPPEKKAQPVKAIVLRDAEDLPPLPGPEGDATTKVLGTIDIQPQELCFITMMGGDGALRGRSTFSLRSGGGGTSLRDWEFVLDDAVIATLALPKNKLVFAWSAAAADKQGAEGLRNCSLRITAGQDEPQELQLRTPVSVPPIIIDLERPKEMSAQFTLTSPPNPAAIRVETTVEGSQYTIEPPQPIEAAKGALWVFFGENRQLAAVALQVEVNVTSSRFQVEAVPYFMVPGAPKPTQLTKPILQQFKSRLQALKSQEVFFKNVLQRLEKEKRGGQAQNQMAQIRLELQALESGRECEKLLDATLAKVKDGQAKLKFRVFYDTLDKQVDLLVSDAPPEPLGKKGKR